LGLRYFLRGFEECYCCIDNRCGVEAIGFNTFNLAGVSRAGKATIIDEAKHAEFQRRRIDFRLGIDSDSSRECIPFQNASHSSRFAFSVASFECPPMFQVTF